MADAKPIRKLSQVGDVSFHPALSGFEARCLCRRLADCEATVQQAFVGASEARRKTCDAPALVRLCQALEATLQQIARAKQLGVSGLALPSASTNAVKPLRYRTDSLRSVRRGAR